MSPSLGLDITELSLDSTPRPLTVVYCAGPGQTAAD